MPNVADKSAGNRPAASNRRQPVRQTRTNPARTASTTVPVGGSTAPAADGASNEEIGFNPAITHFTDSITQLPKEMVRTFTMLKEVDAKICGPEERLSSLLTTASKLPPYRQRPSQGPSDASHFNLARGALYHDIRGATKEMLLNLDEKIHVMNSSVDMLDKQLKRCNTSYIHLGDEISEEARYGSMTHWAYSTDKTADKKGIMASERTSRRANNATAAAAAIHEAEGAAMRSEARREALAARKHKNHHVDSDFDESRARKVPGGGKGRKTADYSYSTNGVGLGIANGTAPSNKRRKVEKSIMGSFHLEKGMSSVHASNQTSARGRAASPRDKLGTDGGIKKRNRGGGTAANGTRRRGNTNTSAINSPSIASSPVMASFPTVKDRQGRSPAPATLQRMPSSRARQNSTQSALHLARNRSSSTNQKAPYANGNGLYSTTADLDKISGTTGRAVGDMKNSMREMVNAKGEHLIEDIAGADGASDIRGGLLVGTKGEDTINNSNGNSRTRAERPPSISISNRGGNGNIGSKQPSKNATPLTATFADPPRSARLPRNTNEPPQKRSHKKGAGLAAQQQAAAAQQQAALGDASSNAAQDEEDEDSDEPTYCYCDSISYGEMVACDNEKRCERKWFHLDCVGLSRAPAKNVKWYCDDCKEKVKKSKFNGGGNNGR